MVRTKTPVPEATSLTISMKEDLEKAVKNALLLSFKEFYRIEDLMDLFAVSPDTITRMNLPWAPLYPNARVIVVSRDDLRAHLKRMRGNVPDPVVSGEAVGSSPTRPAEMAAKATYKLEGNNVRSKRA